MPPLSSQHTHTEQPCAGIAVAARGHVGPRKLNYLGEYVGLDLGEGFQLPRTWS